LTHQNYSWSDTLMGLFWTCQEKESLSSFYCTYILLEACTLHCTCGLYFWYCFSWPELCWFCMFCTLCLYGVWCWTALVLYIYSIQYVFKSSFWTLTVPCMVFNVRIVLFIHGSCMALDRIRTTASLYCVGLYSTRILYDIGLLIYALQVICTVLDCTCTAHIARIYSMCTFRTCSGICKGSSMHTIYSSSCSSVLQWAVFCCAKLLVFCQQGIFFRRTLRLTFYPAKNRFSLSHGRGPESLG
jgi:hypothetical protein